jgi:hypothetical protein
VTALRPLIVFVLLILPGSPSAAQDPQDPLTFAADIRRLADDIKSATPQTAAEIEKRIPAVWRVQDGSRRYDVPAGWLRTTLRSDTGDAANWTTERSIAVERLTAMAREAEALAGGTDGPSPSDARAALDRVLADREFARLHTESAMTRLWNRVVDWFAGILRRLGLGRVAEAATAEAIAWAVSLVALGALVLWLVRLLQRSPRAARLPTSTLSPQTLSAGAWARRAAAAEDLREAVRCAYRAAMCRLEEEGVWRVDDARTPREYLRLLPEDHRRRRPVTDVARRFEEIWYGAREATPDDRSSLLGRLRELECLPAE